MSDLQGKTVMVTGAGGGLASVLAPALERAGAALVLVGHGGDVEADLTNPGEVARLADFEVDALVHTVGGFAMQKAPDATPDDLRRMFALNVDTLFHAAHAVLPGMLARGRGLILGVGAGQAARGAGPGAALYTAAKSAVGAYLKSLDAELKGQGVRATVLLPMGAIDTPKNREDGLKPEAMIDPADLADAVVFALARSPRGHVDEVRVNPR